ncbi:MAG: Tyrosine phosphatase family [Rhodobacteraceae bacterium HLUCCO07]|nr:MAG: Tyrosine phosphatase family [Rhodobacteraceae bacterium HLUCCO07]
MTPIAKFHTWRRNLRDDLKVSSLATPEDRRKARQYMLWFDHEIVRIPWANFGQVAPGVYRSNQPTRARLENYAARGIKTILFLRAASPIPPYLFARENCEALGLTLVERSLSARSAPKRERVMDLIATFPTLEKPFLMHCKSGADRASLASVIWLLSQEGASVAQARKMLSPRFIHFKWTRTGILDYFLDTYEARNARTPIRFADWVATEYDPAALQAGFDDKVPPA